MSLHVRASAAARSCAGAAAVLGVVYALVSVYWALGGTALVNTVGGSIERDARSGGVLVTVGLLLVAALKLIGAWLPLRAVTAAGGPLRRLAHVEAWVLTLYGLVLTVVGLLVQVGIVASGRGADHTALAWHAFLWDPWFLVWGLLIVAALWLSAPRRRGNDDAE